jgi:hypothetical protein
MSPGLQQGQDTLSTTVLRSAIGPNQSPIHWVTVVHLVLVKKQGDPLCSLLARVPGYRSRDPGSSLGLTRFSEKWWVWDGVNSAS